MAAPQAALAKRLVLLLLPRRRHILAPCGADRRLHRASIAESPDEIGLHGENTCGLASARDTAILSDIGLPQSANGTPNDAWFNVNAYKQNTEATGQT